MTEIDMSGYAINLNSPETNQLDSQFKITRIPSVIILWPDGKTISKNGRSDISNIADSSVSKCKSYSNYTNTKDVEPYIIKLEYFLLNWKVNETDYVDELVKDTSAEHQGHFTF